MHTLADPGLAYPCPPSIADDGRALYVGGLLALRNGEAEEAVTLLTQALRRQPGHAGRRRNLVRALLLARRWEQVAMQANASLEGSPDDAELHFARGTALNALGHHTDACGAFAQALSLQPSHAASWLNMGNASVDLDNLGRAETLYRTAIGLDPALVETYASLGYLLTRQGRLREAIEACEAAIRSRPDFVQAHWNLAIAALLSGDLPRGSPNMNGASGTRIIRRISRRFPAKSGTGRIRAAGRFWCGRSKDLGMRSILPGICR
jgi:tetratricopeptide (TPR) repeat protein